MRPSGSTALQAYSGGASVSEAYRQARADGSLAEGRTTGWELHEGLPTTHRRAG